MAAGLLVAGIVALASRPSSRPTDVLSETVAAAPSPSSSSPFPPYDATCQVDPVQVSYESSHGAADYRVDRVILRGLQQECSGATLTVRLQQGDTVLASTTGTVAPPVTGLVVSDRPKVADVTRVRVEIAGGQVPVPTECQGMVLDQPVFGTPGADALNGTPRGDLLYGLGGNDAIDGLAEHDCIVGGDGIDSIAGGAGNDVLLGGVGADSLYGGPGGDTLYGGPGDDFLDGGPGKDTCHRGGGTDTLVSCEVVRP